MASKRDKTGVTVGDELANLERMFAHKSGLRLRAAAERVHRRASAAALWSYLESTNGGSHYALHQTVFAKRERRSERWWTLYFKKYVFNGWKSQGTSIQRMGIID